MNTQQPKIKLYWVEEQEIYQKLLAAIFDAASPVEVVSTGRFSDFQAIIKDLNNINTDLFLIGCINLSQELIELLDTIRKEHRGLGLVILAGALKYEDVPALRSFMSGIRSSCGIILKKSLNETEQLYNTLIMVSSGQVVIDPKLAGLIASEKDKSALTRGLTAREMEILNFIAQGYTNIAISDALCIDVKTVRHHINNMYSKLKASTEFDNRHPRVSATNIYLRLTGQLVFDEQTAVE